MDLNRLHRAKEALLARFETARHADDKIAALRMLSELFRTQAAEHPNEICAWAGEVLKKVFWLYSDADQVRFDRARLVAALMGICFEISELLEQLGGRLTAV